MFSDYQLIDADEAAAASGLVSLAREFGVGVTSVVPNEADAVEECPAAGSGTAQMIEVADRRNPIASAVKLMPAVVDSVKVAAEKVGRR